MEGKKSGKKIQNELFESVEELPENLFDIDFQNEKLDELLDGKTSTTNFYDTELFQQWKTQFANSYSRRKQSDSFYWRKRNTTLKFLFEWTLRMKSMHNMPRRIVQLSIFLFQHGCPTPIWKILSRLKLVLSIKKTKEIINELKNINIPEKLKWRRSNGVMVMGADNCSYYNGSAYVRENNPSKFLETINYYERFWLNPPTTNLDDEEDLIQPFSSNREFLR